MMPFPISESTPIRFPGPPPAACDVVVIGGGVIGVMTAWYLAERGQSVVLCEKGRIAGEQSSRNWGWVRQQGRDFAELPIMIESLRIWQSLAQEFGDDLGFRRDGVLYLARSHAEMEGFEAWLAEAKGHGVDTRMLTRQAVGDLVRGTAAPWLGGMFTPSDARAEPWVTVPHLAQGAARRGAVLVENCAVRTLDIAAGQISGVVTEAGRIACAQVVLAGGAWSSLFARAHGVSFPQLSVRATVAATTPLPQVFAGNATDDRIAFRRRQDGGYSLAPGSGHDFFIGPDAFRSFAAYLPVLKKDFSSTTFYPAAPRDYPDSWGTTRRWSADGVSPFERNRVLNPAPSRRLLAGIQREFAAAFPEIGAPPLRAAWAGMIDSMPDVVPVVDRASTIPGLVIATGMSGHGFGIGPGMGRVIADLVLGSSTGHDIARFRLNRFADGSEIAPGPSL
jgi:glycine/D-amino acid oxidase-like deaminating enzyme